MIYSLYEYIQHPKNGAVTIHATTQALQLIRNATTTRTPKKQQNPHPKTLKQARERVYKEMRIDRALKANLEFLNKIGDIERKDFNNLEYYRSITYNWGKATDINGTWC